MPALVKNNFTEVLRDAATRANSSAEKSASWRSLGGLQRLVIELALPLFTEAESDSLELVWSFPSETITMATPGDARNGGEMAETAIGKMSAKAWLVLQQLSKAVLRHGLRFKQAALLKAYDDLLALCLQLGQIKLPTQKQACALATASKALPRSLPKSRICAAWMQQLGALAQEDPPFRCSPSDLEQAVQQLGRMLSEDASSLIDCHILMWRTHPAR